MLSRYNRAVLALAVAALALVLSGCALATVAGKIVTAHPCDTTTCPAGEVCYESASGSDNMSNVKAVCAAPMIPAPGQQCSTAEAGLHAACWHDPDGKGWRYRCGDGVTDAAGPEGCPVAPPPVTPPAAGCSIDGEPGAAIPGHVSTFGGTVNDVIRQVTGQDGGRIVVEQGRQAFQAAVIAGLRSSGLCAGQHEPGSDEIAVATSTTSPREGYHIYAGPSSGPGTAVLSPQADRGAYGAPANHPGIPESSCGDPAPPALGRINLDCRPGRPGVTVCDSTPLVYSPGGTYCASIGFFNADGVTGRLFCSPRQEGDPRRLPCEQDILGGPAPVFTWTGPASQFRIRDNPFTVEFTEGSGRVKACNADRSLCSEVRP
jgi:hypothetical protein